MKMRGPASASGSGFGCGVAVDALDFQHVAEVFQQEIHQVGVELDAFHFPDVVDAFCDVPFVFVRPAAGEGVKDVGYGDDASIEADFLALLAVGIAVTIPPLVVFQGDNARYENNFLGAFLGAQDVAAKGGVLFDQLELFVVELALLVEYFVGDTHFADVVHGGCMADQGALFVAQSGVAGQGGGIFADAADMVAGFLVAEFRHIAEDFNDVELGTLQFAVGNIDFIDHAIERLPKGRDFVLGELPFAAAPGAAGNAR